MELRQLRQALMLAETLNFSRAAERLHMAQPPLSASIRKLEEELGAVLFERLPTGVKVTPVGESVLRTARRALFYIDEVRRVAREGEAGEHGVLRLGYTSSAAYDLVPRLIGAFRTAYPAVELILDEASTTEMLRAIEAQTLDAAIVAYPVLEPTTATITLIEPGELQLAVRADSELARRDSVAFADLAGVPFIIHSRHQAPTLHALTMNAFLQTGVRPNIVQEVTHVRSLLSLVESGMGVGLVAAFLGKHVSGAIKLLPLTDGLDRITVGLALATSAEDSTATARNFVAIATRLSSAGDQVAKAGERAQDTP